MVQASSLYATAMVMDSGKALFSSIIFMTFWDNANETSNAAQTNNDMDKPRKSQMIDILNCNADAFTDPAELEGPAALRPWNSPLHCFSL
jgi:hypothetical protein